jgi:hypothetical protein
MNYLYCGLEFHVGSQNDSVVSMKPTEKIEENISHSIITEEIKGEENFGTAPVDAISAFSPEMIDSDAHVISSSKSKGTVIFISEWCFFNILHKLFVLPYCFLI